MKSQISLLLLLICYAMAYGQLEQPSAIAAAQGNTLLFHLSGFTAYNNPSALIDSQKQIAFDINHATILFDGYLSKTAIGMSSFHQNQGFGIVAQQFGDEYFKHRTYSASYARRFKPLQLGLLLGLEDIQVQNQTQQLIPFLKIGLLYQRSAQLKISSVWHYRYPTTVNEFTNERPPSTLQFGLQYAPAKRAHILFQIDQSMQSKPQVKMGVAYQIFQLMHIRFGAQIHPYLFGAGLELQLTKWSFASTAQYHPLLGILPQVQIGCRWKR